VLSKNIKIKIYSNIILLACFLLASKLVANIEEGIWAESV
jgi:hypothetical protein